MALPSSRGDINRLHQCGGRYLYKSNSPGVQDYLCNRLYTLQEAELEKYLSQLCQLLINRPYGPLEKVVVDLCAKSLRIAVKVRCHLEGGSCLGPSPPGGCLCLHC